MRGHPGHNSRPHARYQPSVRGMDTWMFSQLDAALIRKLRGSLVFLAYFFLTAYPWVLYNETLVDVRSTGAGIKCLYCSTDHSFHYFVSQFAILWPEIVRI